MARRHGKTRPHSAHRQDKKIKDGEQVKTSRLEKKASVSRRRLRLGPDMYLTDYTNPRECALRLSAACYSCTRGLPVATLPK